MSKEFQTIYESVKVQFYFGSEDAETRQIRIERAENLLSGEEKRPILKKALILRDGIEEVTLMAYVPKKLADAHHSFDSQLNQPFHRGGAEAGIVIEFAAPIKLSTNVNVNQELQKLLEAMTKKTKSV